MWTGCFRCSAHPLLFSTLTGGWGCLMSNPCLESKGCHLIPLSYLLSCFSAEHSPSVLFYVCVEVGFVDWQGFTYIWEVLNWSMCLLMTKFDCPDVTLSGWQDVNIQLPTNLGGFQLWVFCTPISFCRLVAKVNLSRYSGEFSSPVSSFCADSCFIVFQPHVTAVACKRFQSVSV